VIRFNGLEKAVQRAMEAVARGFYLTSAVPCSYSEPLHLPPLCPERLKLGNETYLLVNKVKGILWVFGIHRDVRHNVRW
jgi:hypothetical protein